MRLFIRLPHPWGIKRLRKVIPGLREGAKLWIEKADEVFDLVGWKKIVPGFYADKNSSVLRYMDDLVAAIQPEVLPEYLESLKQQIVLDEITDGFPTKI